MVTGSIESLKTTKDNLSTKEDWPTIEKTPINNSSRRLSLSMPTKLNAMNKVKISQKYNDFIQSKVLQHISICFNVECLS